MEKLTAFDTQVLAAVVRYLPEVSVFQAAISSLAETELKIGRAELNASIDRLCASGVMHIDGDKVGVSDEVLFAARARLWQEEGWKKQLSALLEEATYDPAALCGREYVNEHDFREARRYARKLRKVRRGGEQTPAQKKGWAAFAFLFSLALSVLFIALAIGSAAAGDYDNSFAAVGSFLFLPCTVFCGAALFKMLFVKQTPVQEQAPAEVQTPAEGQAPAEGQPPAEEQAPAEVRTPVQEQAPAEVRTPVQEQPPAEARMRVQEQPPAKEQEVPERAASSEGKAAVKILCVLSCLLHAVFFAVMIPFAWHHVFGLLFVLAASSLFVWVLVFFSRPSGAKIKKRLVPARLYFVTRNAQYFADGADIFSDEQRTLLPQRAVMNVGGAVKEANIYRVAGKKYPFYVAIAEIGDIAAVGFLHARDGNYIFAVSPFRDQDGQKNLKEEHELLKKFAAGSADEEGEGYAFSPDRLLRGFVCLQGEKYCVKLSAPFFLMPEAPVQQPPEESGISMIAPEPKEVQAISWESIFEESFESKEFAERYLGAVLAEADTGAVYETEGAPH